MDPRARRTAIHFCESYWEAQVDYVGLRGQGVAVVAIIGGGVGAGVFALVVAGANVTGGAVVNKFRMSL